MRHFPLFVDLAGRLVVVIGGGVVAERKVEAILGSGAVVRLVAPVVTPALRAHARSGAIEHLAAAYAPDQIAGSRLVIAACGDRATNLAVAAAAEARGILVNVVDDLQSSNCLFPAVVDRSPLIIAVGTCGAAPALAQLVRERIEVAIDESFGRLAALLGRWRGSIKRRVPDLRLRRRFYDRILRGSVAGHVKAGRDDAAEWALRREIEQPVSGSGRVIIVGAGPGDPGLLTLNAVRALGAADVVLHDRLVSAEILVLARREATLVEVGKRPGGHGTSQDRIQRMLVDYARRGLTVVRLKGGDPFIFGRGGEELEHLRACGIDYQVVPGLTAASAAASYAGIPLTHRDFSATARIVTAHCRESVDTIDWRGIADGRETLAVYMGVGSLAPLRDALLRDGRAPETPIAFIENGTRPEQRVILGTLEQALELAASHELKSPALLIVGSVSRLAAKLHWFGEPPLGGGSVAGAGPAPGARDYAPDALAV